MWFFPTKKEIKKSFNKIKSSITELTSQTLNNRVLIEKNQDKIKEFISKKEIDLMIENAILKVQVGLNHEPKSEPISISSKKKNFNEVMIKKAIKTRPDVIKQTIQALIERDMNTTNIFRIIVSEKRLCGKTQFYHYLSLVRTELRSGLRTELRTKQ